MHERKLEPRQHPRHFAAKRHVLPPLVPYACASARLTRDLNRR
jgi:hypothetical protein